jgi:hypothetical protein
MRPLTKTVIRAGLVADSVLSEMRRWGFLVETSTDDEAIEDPDVVILALQDALESHEQVRVQDTDLDIVQRWIDPDNQVEGQLIMLEDGRRATRKIVFCWTVMKEVALPWAGESIVDLLINGETHLRYEDEDGKHKVFFSDVRELYVGDTKAFMVCSIYREKK